MVYVRYVRTSRCFNGANLPPGKVGYKRWNVGTMQKRAKSEQRVVNQPRNLLVFIHSRNAPVITLVKFGLGEGLKEWNGPSKLDQYRKHKVFSDQGIAVPYAGNTCTTWCNECGGRNIWHMFIREGNNLHCQAEAVCLLFDYVVKQVLENVDEI